MTQEKKHFGSRWWKFDFHNHTPASSDYRGDKDVTPKQWLTDYLNNGIQCIVVTDHNSGGWINKLKEELARLKEEDLTTWENMTIFPGVELSCSGGVHLLAILDPSKETSDIDYILGQVGYSGTRGDSDSVTSQGIEGVIRAIHSVGGIACAAHIDCAKGLLVSVNDHNTLQSIFKLLDAVEIIDPSNSLIQQHASNLDKLASILGSDSHQPSQVGGGYTWVKMSTPSIEGLKLASLDPETAIRRSDVCADYPQQLNHSQIKNITIEKIRLRQREPLVIHFNPSYNAFIGGRGSGKSTILECLRLGLARENELLSENAESSLKHSFDNFRKEKTSRNSPGMMLNDTKIFVEVSKGQGDLEEKFKYSWSKGIDGKFSVSVKRWEDDIWQETQLTEEQSRNNFPVKIFSQKQILALADNPQHLIQYIDEVLGGSKDAWESDFAAKREILNAARERVRSLEQKIAQKPALELQYREASRKARVFSTSNFGEALQAYQRARKQKQAIISFFDEINNNLLSMKLGIDNASKLKQINLSSFEELTDTEKAEKQVVKTLLQKFSDEFEKIENSIMSMQQDLETAKANNQSSAWFIENQNSISSYEGIVENLKSQGISNAEEATHAIEQEEALRKRLEYINSIAVELEDAQKAVNLAQHSLNQERLKLTQRRQELLDRILEDTPNLKITLKPLADAEDAAIRLREILRIENEGTFIKEIYGETDDIPPKLCGMLWDLTDPSMATTADERLQEIKLSLEEMNDQVLNTKLHGKFVKKLKDMKPETASVVFDELAAWYPEDLVSIEYRRNSTSSFQNLQQASAGQKTAAILSFLLAHGDEPLLMDQPEDDLDNALVSQLVVTQLRKNKIRRQLIVITHNANIVVNGDADLVMPLEFAGGQIVNNVSGGLQDRLIRTKICEIMEGGEKAFEQRYKRILQDMKR